MTLCQARYQEYGAEQAREIVQWERKGKQKVSVTYRGGVKQEQCPQTGGVEEASEKRFL